MFIPRISVPGLIRRPDHTLSDPLFVNLFGEKGIIGVGEEHSDPAIVGADGLLKNRDQTKETGFDRSFIKRLELLRTLGVTFIRIGVGYSRTASRDVYNFRRLERYLTQCEHFGIRVIANLLQFGIHPSLHNDTPEEPYFQNTRFPEQFARYAASFARRFPHIRYYSLVNEPYVTANFSAYDGRWNEGCLGNRFRGHVPFARAVVNIARAAILARQAVEQVWQQEGRSGSPVFFQNDSFEEMFCEDGDEQSELQAWNENVMSLVGLDLIFGHKDQATLEYLTRHGIARAEIDWCLENGTTKNTVLGVDHYPTCIKICTRDGIIRGNPSMPLLLEAIIAKRWMRYCGDPAKPSMPILLMEVNGTGDEGPVILIKYVEALQRLLTRGYPVLGLLWHPGSGHLVDWDPGNFLSRVEGFHCRCGLFYEDKPELVLPVFMGLLESGFSIPTWVTRSSFESV